jgi:ABC-type lipoprotein release transport system permease subunit
MESFRLQHVSIGSLEDADAEHDVVQACNESDIGFEDWTTVRIICTACSVGSVEQILSVCSLLAFSGLIAAIIPALRAASINPMQVLRTE